MCQRVVCGNCGKATYQGCGMHVEQVLADVPEARRWTCRATKAQPAPTRRRFFGRR
jgi:hypothetical protein